jgi:hypothetical protein
MTTTGYIPLTIDEIVALVKARDMMRDTEDHNCAEAIGGILKRTALVGLPGDDGDQPD